jgi:hypothetical protein
MCTKCLCCLCDIMNWQFESEVGRGKEGGGEGVVARFWCDYF